MIQVVSRPNSKTFISGLCAHSLSKRSSDDFIQTKQQGQQKKEGAKTKDTTNVLFLNSSMTRTNQLVIFNIIIISMMFK